MEATYDHPWPTMTIGFDTAKLILSKASLIVPAKLNYEILNIKVSCKYYTSYIIQNIVNNITRVVLSAVFDV